MTIKGAVPGATGGLIILTKLGKVTGYTPPPEEKPSEEEEIVETPKEGTENAG